MDVMFKRPLSKLVPKDNADFGREMQRERKKKIGVNGKRQRQLLILSSFLLIRK